MIINFPDPAQKSNIVQLRGPHTEVEKCFKFMQKMVAEMVRLNLCSTALRYYGNAIIGGSKKCFANTC